MPVLKKEPKPVLLLEAKELIVFLLAVRKITKMSLKSKTSDFYLKTLFYSEMIQKPHLWNIFFKLRFNYYPYLVAVKLWETYVYIYNKNMNASEFIKTEYFKLHIKVEDWEVMKFGLFTDSRRSELVNQDLDIFIKLPHQVSSSAC